MASNRKLILIMVFFLALAAWQSFYFYPRLPEQIATHYGVAGEPDNFVNKKAGLILNFAIFCLLNGMFLGMAWLTRKVPEKLLNIPNKDFWLKPENKPRAMELISGFGLEIGIVTDFFLLILFQHIYTVNISEEKINVGMFWIGLLIYFVTIGLIIWQFYQIFRTGTKERGVHQSS